jgi:hypothetical protein
VIEVHRFDPEKLRQVKVRGGEFTTWIQQGIDQAECAAAFEEWRPDEPHGYFVFWYDEVHFAISGEAECTYRLPPTFNEEHTLRVKAGDLYFLPVGIHHEWRILGDEPYRFVWVSMPRPKWFDTLVGPPPA